MNSKTEKFSISSKYINKRCGLHLKEYQSKNPNNQEQLGIINSKGNFTACRNCVHIDRSQYNIVVPQIIDEFIKAGFQETMMHFEKKCDINKIYEKLSQEKCDIDKLTAQKVSNSNMIIKNYMPHIYDVSDHNSVNIKSLWTKEKLEHAFKLLDKPQYTVNSYMSELLKKLKFSSVTIYSPLMTKRILEELDCKKVFDPCIGWGGRMLGTTCLGEDYHYTGCEPFTKTFKGLENMVNDLNINSKVNLYNSPVEKMLDTLKDNEYDCCLTSPPYYDLEIYSDEDTQSIKQYKTYEEWLDKFIEPIIEYVAKTCKKYSCWSVKNFKTDKEYKFLDDIIKLHEKYNWKLYREYSIKKNTQKNKSASGDVTYIFKI